MAGESSKIEFQTGARDVVKVMVTEALMATVERQKSSNELPDLIVDVDREDWTVGFDRCAWHTHGDILYAWGYLGSPAEATRKFVDDILESRRQITVWRMAARS